MRMKQLCGRLLVAALAGLPLQTWAVGGDGLYFVQNFEDASQYPETKLGQEQTFNVEGQGEWIFYNSFQSTNASYNENGSTMNLRMPKSGSYVVTPLLQQGVSRMTFYIGRASVKAYTSTDGGQTWAEAAISTTGKTCTVTVNSMDVNRIKLANDTSKDADIDNIAVYALQFDQPVRVATGAATDITTSSAVVAATIVENSGETLTEAGFVWSIVNKEPTLNDNVAPAKNVPASDFTVQLTELKQGATVYYRAYVRYANTQTYGEVKSFKVAVEASEQTVAADGTYFVQDFEDPTAFPQESGAQAVEYYVTGQGVWIYNNAYKSTNSNYNAEGSTMNLRLPKNGSYVVTPVLNYGVKSVSYYGPRKGDKLTCYTSKDGGSTWKAVAQTSTGNNNYAIAINDLEVNRIKIANDGSGDADIDNLAVTAQAYGTPAIVETGSATDITKNTAVLTGTIVDAGDQPLQESGFVWSTENSVPTLADNVVETEDPQDLQLSVMVTGLKAEQTVYYRAYALSNAGYAYGDVRSFLTAEATMPVVQTQEVVKSGSRYKATGIVTDDGGMALTEVGFIYGTDPVAPESPAAKVSLDPKAKFTATLTLNDNTVYYIRAYAKTAKGTAFGEMLSFKTDEVEEKPDEIVGDEIWCSPFGDDTVADGSEQKPFFDLQKAIDIAEPGDRIWMKAGTYVYDKRINIIDHNGTPEAPIQVFAYGGRAVLDFSGMPYHKHSDNPYQGVRLTSSYWHFYKIDITNASDNGMLIERNKPTGGSASDIIARTQDAHDNIIEQCNFYRNGDTGLQMKNLGAYNYIINCDSYENRDEGDGDADGFAPKISVGDGNYMFGCRAWNNSDDGYDVFFKKTGGFEDNKTIIMEYCLAYENGIMNGAATSGNGNGFKMGSDQGRMNCILNRCLAVRNLNKGFDQNHNSGDIIMNNCTGIGQTDVGGKSYSYRIYEALASGSVCEIQNSIAINDRLTTDRSETEDGKRGVWGRFEVTVASKEEACDWKAAPECFLAMNHPEQLIGERQEDGSLPEVDYAHIDLTKGKQYIDAGVTVEANAQKYAAANVVIPAIEYAGQAPDLGAYETDFELADATTPKETTVLPDVPTAVSSPLNAQGSQLNVRQTRDGLYIVAVQGAKACDTFTLRAYTAEGRLLGTHTFHAATVVSLPRISGTVLFSVEGTNFRQAKKLNAR
ncbi:MAG: right-handed parallel beta-helix repeat-containing protein [Prevotella sp.]|nr:right-handed parallel beta-helix repeat-containing protein [Prevotella sp.]